MFSKNLKSIWSVKSLRTKIIITLLFVIAYKLLATIPVPGVNPKGLELLQKNIEGNSGLSFFSSLMGGGLTSFSIILMGLSPYINSVIIMQLLGIVIPKLEALQKEGEQGQKKITKMTRYLALPFAFVQSYGMIIALNSLSAGPSLIDTSNAPVILMAMTIITAGTMLLIWLGELMTEYGIGNGISVIITAGVLTRVPSVILKYTKALQYKELLGMMILTLAIIWVIIKFTEGIRRIPIIYSRTGREEESYFPIRVNQAGMVPIIFAVSIVTFPSILGRILSNGSSDLLRKIGVFMNTHLSMSTPSWAYIAVYFTLVLLFSYFYISITFKADDIADSIQKRGGYIPGVRPGKDTAKYLNKVSQHLNLYGGSFLGLIAILPYVINKLNGGTTIPFIVSGAGLIIIVSVILDMVRKVDSEMKMFDYSKFR